MPLKTAEEIEIMQQGADLLSKTLRMVEQHATPGTTTQELDKLAETFIRDHGAAPSFKGYKQFPATLCTSVNEEVIHGLPSSYRLKEGDILSVDCGVYYKNYHTDAANTLPIGEIDKELLNLLLQTKKALYLGIEKATPQHTLGDLGHAIQHHLNQHHYPIIKEYGGHGIGKQLHENPHIHNYGIQGKGKKLKNGMVLAIEPIATLGSPQIGIADDKWTIVTQDKKPAAHFEHTVAIINDQPRILTSHL